MSVREPFNWEENLVAATTGLGLLLAISAGLATGFGSDDGDLKQLLLFAGLGLIGVGMALWLVLLRPWEQFDDLETPYFTGHHHDEHDDAHDHAQHEVLAGGGAEEHVLVAEAEPIVEASISSEPVVAYAEDVEPVVEPVIEVATTEDTLPEATIAETIVVPEVAEVVEPETVETVETVEPPAVTPIAVDPDREDDLRVIEGIGAKTEEALKASGIKSFAAVAAHTAEALEHIVKVDHGVRIVGSTHTWRKQAALAAAGDFTALDDLKARIKNGYLYDDLTDIEGIGPAIQEALYEAKIRSYEELAAASLEDLQNALKKGGVSSNRNIETWAQQAQLIVNGDITGFEALKASL